MSVDERERQGLDPHLIHQAMKVTLPPAELPHSVSRAIIDGAVVIYNLDHPPAWLVPVLDARDDNGSVRGAVTVGR